MRYAVKVSLLVLASAFLICCGRSGKRAGAAEMPAAPVQDSTVVFAPGDIVPDEYLATHPYGDFFTVNPVPDDIFALMQGKTFKSDCTIPREDLRYILCLHKDLRGRSVVGEMVCSKLISTQLNCVLLQLYEAGYPIEKMRLPDYWDADDEMMMRDNNSSCFNFRKISGSKTLSKHSRGIAVDINPLYNPYVKTGKDGKPHIEPATGTAYVDRDADYDYKITADDLCCRLFKENGFEWGGEWTSCKDYQHFELIEN